MRRAGGGPRAVTRAVTRTHAATCNDPPPGLAVGLNGMQGRACGWVQLAAAGGTPEGASVPVYGAQVGAAAPAFPGMLARKLIAAPLPMQKGCNSQGNKQASKHAVHTSIVAVSAQPATCCTATALHVLEMRKLVPGAMATVWRSTGSSGWPACSPPGAGADCPAPHCTSPGGPPAGAHAAEEH